MNDPSKCLLLEGNAIAAPATLTPPTKPIDQKIDAR
jgi:hypothetical protein